MRWAPPEDNRSSAILSYIIELRDVTQTKWRRVAIVDATTFHYRVTSLREGEEYYVRVLARNRDGDSLPAQSSLVSTKKSFCEIEKPNHTYSFQSFIATRSTRRSFYIVATPSAPSMLQIMRVAHDSVTLDWMPPVFNGGSDVMRYVINVMEYPHGAWREAGTVSGTSTGFTVDGLREGQLYLFGVCAVNSAGKGDIIETIKPITPKRLICEFSRP